MSDEEKLKALRILRAPFLEGDISLLPKPTKNQTDEVKRDFKKGNRCNFCGGWHHPQVVHLSYVGHAATTKRLLDADLMWDWDFLVKGENQGPVLDGNGGMWITLTVAGMTRKGYGDAAGKQGPNATKELIGDAIRNAAMRFGVALELWHKGEFHREPEPLPEIDAQSDTVTSEQAKELSAAALEAGKDDLYLCEKAGVSSVSEIAAARFDPAIAHLRGLKK